MASYSSRSSSFRSHASSSFASSSYSSYSSASSYSQAPTSYAQSAGSSLGGGAGAGGAGGTGGVNWTRVPEEELPTPPGQLQPLDLGPPGFQATIVLFEGTSDERTVYLGPWEVVGSQHPRILWQCSYQLERLEHYLPSPNTIPHTLHSRHRQFSDPTQLELYVTFPERHRVRYTNGEGHVVLDQPIDVRYEFSTVEAAVRFQGDVRRRDLVDYFDVDVVWTDVHGRTDAFGNVRGIGTVQRLKLWSDRVTTAHSLSVLANRSVDQRYREFQVEDFEGELRGRDERRRTLRLNVRGRRRSSSDARRMISAFRPRQRSVDQASSSAASSSSASAGPLDIRYVGIQFSRSEGYRRFLDAWIMAHSSDSEFRGISYPRDVFELPSPEMAPGVSYEMPASDYYQTELPAVHEPPAADYYEHTP